MKYSVDPSRKMKIILAAVEVGINIMKEIVSVQEKGTNAQ